MAKKFMVQHLGYPTTQAIREDQWKIFSTHETESAAWKRIDKANEGLEYGSWNDHYRVIAPDGRVCDRQEFYYRTLEMKWK